MLDVFGLTMEELDRHEVVRRVLDKRATLKQAAEWLAISERQMRRIVRRYFMGTHDPIQIAGRGEK